MPVDAPAESEGPVDWNLVCNAALRGAAPPYSRLTRSDWRHEFAKN